MAALPLVWMADVLRTAGVEVVEYPGWRERAASGAFAPRAVMWHHDASAAGPSPGMPWMIAEQGNAATPPPLAHAWVDTAGRWHLIAAGRAHHAGTGSGWGRIPAGAGNTYAIGVETDHTVGEAWPAAQLEGLRRGTAALLRRLGAHPSDALCGHLEYAPGRKIDPAGLDMAAERRIVAELLEEDMPDIRQIQDAAYRAVLDALNDARHGRGAVQSEARDSLEIIAREAVAPQLAELAARLDRLATPEIDLDALASRVAELMGEEIARKAIDILTERLAQVVAALRPGAEVRA